MPMIKNLHYYVLTFALSSTIILYNILFISCKFGLIEYDIQLAWPRINQLETVSSCSGTTIYYSFMSMYIVYPAIVIFLYIIRLFSIYKFTKVNEEKRCKLILSALFVFIFLMTLIIPAYPENTGRGGFLFNTSFVVQVVGLLSFWFLFLVAAIFGLDARKRGPT